jgi:hypothetical protein
VHISYGGFGTWRTNVRIPEHAPTHSDNMRPLVPGYPPTSDALP